MATFLLERSVTPIYQRIIQALKNSLEKSGNQVIIVDPSDFLDIEKKEIIFEKYLSHINQQKFDYFIVTNFASIISSNLPESSNFLFEFIENKLIFIHHDNLFIVGYRDYNKILNLLETFYALKDRSFHFCIEYYNVLDLKTLGINNTYLINHASEFNLIPPPKDYQYQLSFVGHCLRFNNETHDNFPYSHLLMADFWQRMVNLDISMEASAIKFSELIKLDNTNSLNQNIKFLVNKYFYLALLHEYSPFFRGELIKRINSNHNVAIIGGDPAYMSRLEMQRKIKRENTSYHLPTNNYADTANIYANSKINLNITPLQFDQTVINRVIDIASVGGFVLTDWKEDLSKLTSVAEEISYRTIDELNYKIDYYFNHEQERLEIADTLHKDIKKHCTYDQIIDFILSKINNTNDLSGVKSLNHYNHSYIKELNLREINLIIFPDWHESTDLIFNDFVRVFQVILNHPQKNQITLLIDIHNQNTEDVEFFLGDILINLCADDNLTMDDYNAPQFTLLNFNLYEEYQTLITFLHSRIVLEYENTELIAQMKLENLSALNLEELKSRVISGASPICNFPS